MRLALVALVLALPAASSVEAPVPLKAGRTAALAPLCGQDMKVRPVRDRGELRARRLGELPPADLTLTVVNRVGGCIEPVTVRQGYGAFGQGR
jgi:hypothetical protein